MRKETARRLHMLYMLTLSHHDVRKVPHKFFARTCAVLVLAPALVLGLAVATGLGDLSRLMRIMPAPGTRQRPEAR